MKPKILKVKGLNSFVDEQIINFDELTSKGLFGIFGPTGSGKSTILDAITMALYGKMSRGMDNYVNSSSDLLVVSFDFEISYNGERKNYIAERSVKRDKNNNTRLSAARLYEKISEDSINVIADGSREVKDAVEKVIGLGFDDFSRSVVLPQGKFSEFLKIPPAERNNMLERLFGLEKYGRNLVDKINSKKKESISELDVLLGQVKSYEDKGITRENYIKEKQELSTLQKEEKKFKEEKENTDKLYEKYKVVWELQEELNVHSNRKIKLEERKKEFEDKKERIIAANKAAVIKPVIDDISKTDKSIKENEEELNKITIHLDKVKNEAEINKKQYETAFLRKETEIPKLIKKETNLNQAVTILIKIDGFEKEREELLEKYKTFNKDKKSLNSEILNLNSDKASIIKGINDIGDRLNIIKVDPEFRENVQNVLSLEKEYNNLLIDKKNREDKIKEKDLNKKKLTKDYEAVCVFRENNRIEILKIEEEMSKSQEKFPGDNNVLLMKQNETSLIKDKYLQSSKDIEKYTELKVRLNEVNKSKSILEKNTDEINKELENKNKIITDLKNQYDEIQIMNRASLIAIDIKEGTPCPVCGSIHHPKIASKIDEHILGENISGQEKLKKEIDTLDKESRKNEIELAKISNEIEHIEIDMKDLQPKIEGVVLTDLEKEKNKKEEEFENLKVSIKNYENLKNELENKLKSIKEEKNKIDRNEAKLGENINSENKHIEELTGEFEKVISEFEKISEKYLQAKKELNIMSAKDTMDNILKNEKETAKLIKEEKKLREDNEIIDKKLDEKNSALNQLEVQIAKIVESGQEKKRVIDGEKLEVSKLSEGEEPKSYIEIVRKQIKEINQNEEKLRIKLEKENEDIKQLSDKKLSAEQNKITLMKLLEEQRSKEEALLKTNQFDSEDSTLKAVMTMKEINNLQNEIDNFEDEYKNSTNNILRIKEKLQGMFIEEEKWKEIIENKNKISEVLDNTIRMLSAKNQVVIDIEKDFKTLQQLEIKKEKVQHKVSLLDDLYSLVKGNSFVEYVAKSQLKYIAGEASKRLRNITRDRYDLEVDNVSGYFTIRDNFNGGTVRATSSLSGGETFLTSLSLALALSTQIQLKGSAPLEFFFLDEGFGTLDNELLETVMTSLEKLHTNRLSIGIISHVEELKNRVPIKLLIEPAENNGKGSQVKIELS